MKKLGTFLFILSFSISHSHELPNLIPENSWLGQLAEQINDFTREVSGELFVAAAKMSNNMVRLYEKYIKNVDDILWDTTEDPSK